MIENVSSDLVVDLFQRAKLSPRLRAHLNLHESFEEKVQRLLIGMLRGSFVEPHYHEHPNQWELFVVLEGSVEVKIYNDAGLIRSQEIYGDESGNRVLQLPCRTIHSVECISEKALLLEVKEGPYVEARAKVFVNF